MVFLVIIVAEVVVVQTITTKEQVRVLVIGEVLEGLEVVVLQEVVPLVAQQQQEESLILVVEVLVYPQQVNKRVLQVVMA